MLTKKEIYDDISKLKIKNNNFNRLKFEYS